MVVVVIDDWLIDWLLAWLVGWLIDWLVVTDWLIDWLVGCDWLIDWLIDWLVVTDWLIDWLIDWLMMMMMMMQVYDAGCRCRCCCWGRGSVFWWRNLAKSPPRPRKNPLWVSLIPHVLRLSTNLRTRIDWGVQLFNWSTPRKVFFFFPTYFHMLNKRACMGHQIWGHRTAWCRGMGMATVRDGENGSSLKMS